MNRDAYDGEVADPNAPPKTPGRRDMNGTDASPHMDNEAHVYHRPATASGGRNMQDSSFTFGGA